MSGVAEAEQKVAEKNPLATQSDNIAQLSEILRNSRTTFFALILACVYSYLTIATTTDAALLSNSSSTPLPIIQVNVPIVWFYYFAPIVLTVLFVYFHLYLERFWRCIVRLPLCHPDGRGLDDYVYPWLISSAFIRGEIPQLSGGGISARLEAWLSLFLGWWLVPIVLLFYWGRFLVAHDWVGTLLHVALILIAAGFSLRFFYTARNSLREMAISADPTIDDDRKPKSALEFCHTQVIPAGLGVLFFGFALLYLSASAIRGLSEDVCVKVGPETSGCTFYGAGQGIWKAIGIEPYSRVSEVRFITKPENWLELLANRAALHNFLDAQRPLLLDGRDMRNMSAREAFLPGSRIRAGTLDYADLQHAVITGARLSDVSLRGADLTDADLQHARIVNTRFEDVIAHAARFDHARFAGATSETRTRFSGDFSGAYFKNASGDNLLFHSGDGFQGETSMRETTLRESSFSWSDFHNVDLSRAAIEEATLTHNSFVDTDFSGATMSDTILNYSTFKRCRLISLKIRDSSFEEAKFLDSEFKHDSRGEVFEGFQGFGAVFGDGSRILNVQFDDADLRSASFNGVVFRNTLFSNTDLSNATFEDVDLREVKFEGVDLSGANLEQARNVLPELLNGACGNARTRLPQGVQIKSCLEGR